MKFLENIIWKSDNGWGSTSDCFIFSFKNNDRIENHALSRVKNESGATCATVHHLVMMTLHCVEIIFTEKVTVEKVAMRNRLKKLATNFL